MIIEDVRFREDGGVLKTTLDKTPFNVQGGKAVLELLSRMHSLYWKAPPEDIWSHSVTTGHPSPYTPPYLRLLGEIGMWRVLNKFQSKLTIYPDVVEAFKIASANYSMLRKFWSTGPLTMVHGDAHTGNMFFSKDFTKVGVFDYQCVAIEHFMRDVSYYLINSCPDSELEQIEQDMIQFHLNKLKDEMMKTGKEKYVNDIPSYQEAYFLYRSHSMWVFIAWVICCGFADVVLEEFALGSLQRVMNTCHRLNVLEAVKISLSVDRS